MNKNSLIRILALGLVILVAGCVSNGGGDQAPEGDTTAPIGGGQITMITEGLSFNPPTLTVNQGEALVVQVTSTDIGHTFTIDELGVNEGFRGGETVSVTIPTNQAGSYTYYCAVPGHRQGGMEGTLEIK